MLKWGSIVFIVLSVIVSLYSSLAFLYGFYDPFYTTSCVALNEVFESNASVVQHSKLYASYYPLSLILNSILHMILYINCLDVGLMPVLPFLHLLLFYTLMLIYFRTDNQRTIVLSLYLCLLIAYLYAVFPPYYVTIGNTGYLLFLYTLLLFIRKRGENHISVRDLIVLLLFFILSTFSYYTSGLETILTALIAIIFSLIQSIPEKKRSFRGMGLSYIRSKVLIIYFTLALLLIYLTFDYMLFQNLRQALRLEFINTIIDIIIYRKIKLGDTHLLYNPPTPPIYIFILARTSFYFVLILSIGFLSYIMAKMFKNKITLTQLVIASGLLSSFLISAYYTFLMGIIYIRYYLYFQLFLIPLVISSIQEKKYKIKVSVLFAYVTLFLIAFTGMYNTIYSIWNPSVLSGYTDYLTKEEYMAICNYINIKIEPEYRIIADLKTAFSMPLKCNNINIYATVIEHQFFSYFNISHNIIINITKGIYLYTIKYMQTPIFMLQWAHYKPFIISHASFDGVIYNSGLTTLWIKS